MLCVEAGRGGAGDVMSDLICQLWCSWDGCPDLLHCQAAGGLEVSAFCATPAGLRAGAAGCWHRHRRHCSAGGRKGKRRRRRAVARGCAAPIIPAAGKPLAVRDHCPGGRGGVFNLRACGFAGVLAACVPRRPAPLTCQCPLPRPPSIPAPSHLPAFAAAPDMCQPHPTPAPCAVRRRSKKPCA